MISALLSFLGGAAFRMIWGEIAAFFTARQEHAHEIERLRLQGDLDAAQHERNQAAIRLQAELGVQTIRVQADADTARLEVQGWAAAVAQATAKTGIGIVDAWNGIIRPLAASIAIGLWVCALMSQAFVMNEWDRELVGMVLGFFFASRELMKRGK